MSQIVTKFIGNNAVTAIKLGSGAATSSQAAFADGSGNVTYRSILSTDVPTLNQNTTGTAANITASSNATITTLSALTTASSLASIGTITSGVWNGTTIAIANGGTGQTSASSAFNALAPATAAGGLIYGSATNTYSNVAIGSSGQVLTVVGGLPVWQTPTITPGDISLTQNHIFVGNGSNLAADVAMSGDATIVASGALTLATVNSDVGTFGDASDVPVVTVNGKGLITAITTAAVVAPAGTLSGTTLNSTVVSSSLTSVGTLTSGTLGTGFTAVAIAQGGTGQTTANAAFDALSPMTTAGDIIYENSTPTAARLPIGTTGEVLTVVGGLPVWAATAATATNAKDTFVLSSTDITNQFVTLTHTPLANSTDLLVQGAGVQLETIDYTVSGAEIVFAGGLATGGVSALVASDTIQIFYQY